MSIRQGAAGSVPRHSLLAPHSAAPATHLYRSRQDACMMCPQHSKCMEGWRSNTDSRGPAPPAGKTAAPPASSEAAELSVAAAKMDPAG